MSKNVVTSAKFSSIEVVDSAKFDNEIVYDDLVMTGAGLSITCSEDIILSSTGTSAPYGISILSVGPVTSSSTGSYNWNLSGYQDGVADVDGSVVLGHSTATTPVSIVEAAYDATADESRIGLFGATAVAQPTTGIAAAAFVANTSGISDDTATFGGYTLGQIVAALQSLGALA